MLALTIAIDGGDTVTTTHADMREVKRTLERFAVRHGLFWSHSRTEHAHVWNGRMVRPRGVDAIATYSIRKAV